MKAGEKYKTKQAYDGTYTIIKLIKYMGNDIWDALVIQDVWGDAPFNTLILGKDLFKEYDKIK